ncbi:MAG: hypothetical protein LBK41_09045 [Clostridiales bacterium]|nr:hypothetical protein [Clostridiales bacterium]
MRFTADDYLEICVMDELNGRFADAAALFASELSRRVAILALDTSGGIYTVPFAEYINVIEDNLRRLTANGYYPQGMEAPKTWAGEDGDMKFLDYRDVNRWFESVRLVEEMTRGIAGRLLRTGTFASGSGRTRQVVRAA